jgi:hypothetical protein
MHILPVTAGAEPCAFFVRYSLSPSLLFPPYAVPSLPPPFLTLLTSHTTSLLSSRHTRPLSSPQGNKSKSITGGALHSEEMSIIDGALKFR